MKKSLVMFFALFFSLVFLASDGWAARVMLKHKDGETASQRDLRAAKIAAESGSIDQEILVVMVDNSGKPIRTKGGSKNVSENVISFTFDSPEHPWAPEILSGIVLFMDRANAAARTVYGPPAFTNTINVRYNPDIYLLYGAPAIYNAQLNEIVVGNANQRDLLVHELLHAYRDELIIGNGVYEEGMTRAAEVAVMTMLNEPDYWDVNHSYVYDVKYELHNVPAISSLFGSFYRGFPNQLMKYQQAGYPWAKILIENPDFLRKFNKAYYSLAMSDPSLSSNFERLKNIVAKLVKSMEGKPFAMWYLQQHILNMNPADGIQIMYTENYSHGYLYIFNRSNGIERAIPDAVVTWEVYDCSGTNLLNGVGVANSNGVFVVHFWQQIAELQYIGRVNMIFNVQTPEGNVRMQQSTLTPTWPEGLHGITPACNSEVKISGPSGNVTVNATNGYFQHIPSGSVAGKFTLQTGSETKVVTKDAAAYYVPF